MLISGALRQRYREIKLLSIFLLRLWISCPFSETLLVAYGHRPQRDISTEARLTSEQAQTHGNGGGTGRKVPGLDPRSLAGALLLAAGGLMLSLYAVPTIYGAGMARLAVARFRSQNSAHQLWGSPRIAAYQKALTLPLAPAEAVLRVPRLGIEAPVLEGTSALVLNRGVGHVPGTALPGQSGNIALAGHRDGFFRALKDVVPGDIIEVERPHNASNGGAQLDRYQVQRTLVVFPADVSVLSRTTGSSLTLITCFPFYFLGAAPQRFIVKAELMPPTSTPQTSDR